MIKDIFCKQDFFELLMNNKRDVSKILYEEECNNANSGTNEIKSANKTLDYELEKFIDDNYKKSNDAKEKKIKKLEWEYPIHNEIYRHFHKKKSLNLILDLALLAGIVFCFWVYLSQEILGETTWDRSTEVAFINYVQELVPLTITITIASIGFIFFLYYYFMLSYHNLGMYNKKIFGIFVIILGLIYPVIHAFVISYFPPTDAVLIGVMNEVGDFNFRKIVLFNTLPYIYLPVFIILFIDLMNVKYIPTVGILYLYALWIRLEITYDEKHPERELARHNVPKYFTQLLLTLDTFLYESLSVRLSNLKDLAEKFTQNYMLDYDLTNRLLKSNFDAIFFDLITKKDLRQLNPALLIIVLDRIDNTLKRIFQDYIAEYHYLRRQSKDEEVDEAKPAPNEQNDASPQEIYLKKIFELLQKQYLDAQEENLNIRIMFESYVTRMKRQAVGVFSVLA